jgi:hypothetical protein
MTSTVPSIELPASPAYPTKINRAALLQDPDAIKMEISTHSSSRHFFLAPTIMTEKASGVLYSIYLPIDCGRGSGCCCMSSSE